MALQRGSRPLQCCLQCTRHDRRSPLFRTFTTSSTYLQDVETVQSTPPPPPPSPTHLAKIVHNPRSERRLLRTHNITPIGSRRRRAALASSANIPFSQLPYQCFQEARQTLLEDREEKVAEITKYRERIARLEATSVDAQEEAKKEHRLDSMRRKLEETKILADINDPIVKKKFEDGMGDMGKPIYRHLADKKWRSYKRLVLMQRIEQMTVIPDILPHIDPVVSASLSFGRKRVQHGDIVLSTTSERPPTLEIQPFDKGERLVTIAVVNPDVPDVSKDGFNYRCHFLACNIPISPTRTKVEFANLDREMQVVLPWLPAWAQKGLPYQRMGIFVFEQGAYEGKALVNGKRNGGDVDTLPSSIATSPSISDNETAADPLTSTLRSPPTSSSSSNLLPMDSIRAQSRHTTRENFILRSFASKYNLKPVGVDLFRTQWDEGTAGVMKRAGVTGWDVEFRRKRVEPLPYKRLKAERYR